MRRWCVGGCFGMGEVSTGPESAPLGGKRPPILTLELVKGSYGGHSSISKGVGGSCHLRGLSPAPLSCRCLGQGSGRQGSNQHSSCHPWLKQGNVGSKVCKGKGTR